MQTTRTFGIDDIEDLAKLVFAGDFKAFENAKVAPDHRKAKKSWHKDVSKEWQMLLRQFGPGTATAFAVPLLTPMLRRRIEFDFHFDLFHRLWAEYEVRLLKELSSRWLVSVCDTLMLNPRSPEEEAWAFAGAFFMKTIKLYETEELRLEKYPKLTDPVVRVDTERMGNKHGRIMLFDGIQPFHLGGNGDMIEKMGNRLNRVNSDQVSYKVMRELFRRAHQKETVYRRIETHVSQFRK